MVVLQQLLCNQNVIATEPKISGEREMGLLSMAQKSQGVGLEKSYIVFCAEKLQSNCRLFSESTCPNLNLATGLDETDIQNKSPLIMNQLLEWESGPDSELNLDVYSVDFYM